MELPSELSACQLQLNPARFEGLNPGNIGSSLHIAVKTSKIESRKTSEVHFPVDLHNSRYSKAHIDLLLRCHLKSAAKFIVIRLSSANICHSELLHRCLHIAIYRGLKEKLRISNDMIYRSDCNLSIIAQ